jgi:hypothetical protein
MKNNCAPFYPPLSEYLLCVHNRVVIGVFHFRGEIDAAAFIFEITLVPFDG